MARAGQFSVIFQMQAKLNNRKAKYVEALRIFERLVNSAVTFSDASGGLYTSNLGIEATKIYTRITLSAMTITSVLPENRVNETKMWDFPSIATLARTFLETCHRYLYLSECNLDKEDASFRLKLYYFHMNSEKYRLYKEFGADQKTLSEFDENLPKAKDALMSSSVYSTLSKHMAEKVRRGNTDMYFSDDAIAEKYVLLGGKFNPIYRLLSNHAHGAPFATFSQSNERGRGVENDAEVDYITLSLNLLNQYLAFVIQRQVKLLSLEHVDAEALEHAKQVASFEGI